MVGEGPGACIGPMYRMAAEQERSDSIDFAEMVPDAQRKRTILGLGN